MVVKSPSRLVHCLLVSAILPILTAADVPWDPFPAPRRNKKAYSEQASAAPPITHEVQKTAESREVEKMHEKLKQLRQEVTQARLEAKTESELAARKQQQVIYLSLVAGTTSLALVALGLKVSFLRCRSEVEGELALAKSSCLTSSLLASNSAQDKGPSFSLPAAKPPTAARVKLVPPALPSQVAERGGSPTSRACFPSGRPNPPIAEGKAAAVSRQLPGLPASSLTSSQTEASSPFFPPTISPLPRTGASPVFLSESLGAGSSAKELLPSMQDAKNEPRRLASPRQLPIMGSPKSTQQAGAGSTPKHLTRQSSKLIQVLSDLTADGQRAAKP